MVPRSFKVGRSGRPTPIIVPSFSSKDPLAAKRLAHLGHLLLDRLLVSALDLSRGHLTLDALLGKELVFVDSGGYEAQVHAQWSKSLSIAAPPWTAEEHEALVGRLPKGPTYLLTSLDKPPYESVLKQVEAAQGFRARHPDHDVEFLLKPPAGEAQVTALHVTTVAGHLAGFGTLGVAEEDLGASIKARVQTVHAIRRALTAANCNVPLHIYGCINPSMIYLYCAAGADVFDGLGWFQHAFDRGRAVHIDDWAVTYGDWRIREGEVLADVDTMNLVLLGKMEESLVRTKGVPNQEDLAKSGLGMLPFAALSALLKECGVT